MVKIQIIAGSTRNGRQGIKIAQWIFSYAQKIADVEAELLDLKLWNLPIYDEPEPDIAKQWMKKVAVADGYVIVTPEYNHGYPASLKNALDYPYEEWNRKVVGFIAYSGGRGAGIRAVEQLKQVVIELQMAPLREAIYIPRVKEAFDENGHPKDETLNESAKEFFDELLWWTKALKEARSKG